MLTLRRSCLALILVLIAMASSHAQSRLAPAQATPQTFVEQAEPGAAGPFLWVSLRGRDQHGNAKAAHDVGIYDPRTGGFWLVRNRGAVYGYSSPYYAYTLLEQGCGFQLRAGLGSLIASDVDGDGRDDLIGHDRNTGVVVRYYQRGQFDGCQP